VSVGVAWLVSIALALVVCWRSLGRGIYLYRDFVTVPDPVLGPQAWGADGQAPRAVPLDAVMAMAATVVPPGVQQQVMLVGALVLAGSGAALLLRRHGLAAMVAASAVATWNPFVAERLLLGQPPTLLAYSMTPWVVVVVRSRLTGWRALAALVVVAAPAALTPWGGLTAFLTAVVVSLVTPSRRDPRWLAAVVVAGVVWCLPWVVPAVVHGTGAADADGAAAFAAGADGPLGTLGSVLTLGGIWAPAARPGSRESVVAVAMSVLLLAVVLTTAATRLRRTPRGPQWLLAASLVVPPLAAWLAATHAGVAVGRTLQAVPGVAIARDSHRWLGFAAIATALLVGLAVGAVARRLTRSAASRPFLAAVPASAAVAVVAVAVLTVADLPRLVHTAYEPVQMPSDWAPALAAVRESAGEGTVLVVPWSSFRAARHEGAGGATFNAGRPFLDPLPRALDQRVLLSRELDVVRDGRVWVVDADREVLTSLQTAGELDATKLSAAGVSVVVQWRHTVGVQLRAGPDLAPVHEGEAFQVWAVTRR
jgi:hypothetical protein